jgi:hypothetical protein
MRWVRLGILTGALVFAGAAGWWLMQPARLSAEALRSAYATPLPAVANPLRVYHLGHSLVGRTMPAMLDQMMPGHSHESQLGWGATLKGHWTGEVPGAETENDHPRYRPAVEAVGSGDYDAIVLTEMVEIRDAIAYFDSGEHLALWAAKARAARPDVRLYLYETWHRLDDPDGFLDRIETDRSAHWEGRLLREALAIEGVGAIHVIPGGQALAAVVRAVEAGEVPGLSRREDLFSKADDGTQDDIHLNDIGAYVIALTHYAVLYGKSPEGLPSALRRADGSAADAVSAEAAAVIQRVVWQVVQGYDATGVASAPAG